MQYLPLRYDCLYLIIAVHGSEQCAAEVCELVNRLKGFPIDSNGWLHILLVRRGLVEDLNLLGTDLQPKVVAGSGEAVHAQLHPGLSAGVERAIGGKQVSHSVLFDIGGGFMQVSSLSQKSSTGSCQR